MARKKRITKDEESGLPVEAELCKNCGSRKVKDEGEPLSYCPHCDVEVDEQLF